MPLNVESHQFREKAKMAVGQMVMNPPGERPPVCALAGEARETGQHDTRRCPHMAVAVQPVPNVMSVIRVVFSTIQPALIAERIHFG